LRSGRNKAVVKRTSFIAACTSQNEAVEINRLTSKYL